ncbi:translation initiation factor 2 [Streptomyces sp. 15-116A]|uniref:translation initiation factor 2 n=1 Tax=Streptomyces sp. 15-116A TaxID=2259035 RepID=UPI0021B2D87D|nr:translation initiation factor 2 [Streptomyces sp. 15-116A]MCT7353051.1 translation initiation factor 2 [Streptomyces sp. 15-116A]
MLFAARSATALHRLLDVLPVFAGDHRISRHFTLVPGSEFGLDALTAVERAGARTIPWDQARGQVHDVILAASPKGDVGLLHGPCVLLPHGAGFGKTVPGEGSGPATPSGLDPARLLLGDRPLAAVHALAHPSQVSRIASSSPRAAAAATVIGDPTLDRMLASRAHRERYRRALGTGARTLVVLTSTWGPESLLRQRPELAAELVTLLPYDSHQVALIVHPNERSRLGSFELAERLAPALDAGLILPGPYEEWAAVLIAADAVITDHGSTALYAAALDLPLIGAYDGGRELVPGSPMAEFLARGPRLERHALDAGGLRVLLSGHEPELIRTVAESAFAERGRALELLRSEVYRLLDLAPPSAPVTARVLPAPRTTALRTPGAFAVRADVARDTVRVERFPAQRPGPSHHLAAEHGTAGERHAQSAAVLFRRAAPPAQGAPYEVAWTAAGWTEHILDSYPGCRTAAAVLSPSRCLVQNRAGLLLSVRIEPCGEGGRVVTTDPAAVVSAVHAWLWAGRARVPAMLRCEIGGRTYEVGLAEATEEERALGL